MIQERSQESEHLSHFPSRALYWDESTLKSGLVMFGPFLLIAAVMVIMFTIWPQQVVVVWGMPPFLAALGLGGLLANLGPRWTQVRMGDSQLVVGGHEEMSIPLTDDGVLESTCNGRLLRLRQPGGFVHAMWLVKDDGS